MDWSLTIRLLALFPTDCTDEGHARRKRKEHLRTRGVSGEAWELWNVENLAKASGKKPAIQRFRHIPESAMKESGYWIDLNQCSLEPPKSGTPEPQ